MKRMLMVSFGVPFLLVALVATTFGQLPENHYKVYEVPEVYTVPGPVTLFDQFTQATFFDLTLDKFATPVRKNDEPWFDELRHQTWWKIDEILESRIVELFNQFGGQRWVVNDARYLVVPALKNDPTMQLQEANHYKCYDAAGPPMDLHVSLVDQFVSTQVFVVEPVLFCNPAEKEVEGVLYPIVEPMVHLACYRIDPSTVLDIPATAFDQFGDWQIAVEDELWLCVPSEKLRVIQQDNTSWGQLKALYED